MNDWPRYERPRLAATRKGIPDPVLLVDCRLERLEDLRESAGPVIAAGGSETLGAVLSSWGWCQRVRPELIHEVEGEEILRWAAGVLHAGNAEDLSTVLTLAARKTWMEDVKALESSYEDPLEPTQRSAWAEGLLTQLDDAELLACAAESRGVSDDRLADWLAECSSWVAANADCFLACGTWVQAMGQTFRPDLYSLSEHDAAWALTAEKYVRVLDALEDAEADLGYARVESMTSTVAKALWRLAADERALRAEPFRNVPPKRWMEVVMSLPEPMQMSAKTMETPLGATARWGSPDDRYLAFLPCPLKPVVGQVLWVKIIRQEDELEAKELRSTRVRLAGVEPEGGGLDEQGRASFRLDRLLDSLRQSNTDTTLSVGDEVWQELPLDFIDVMRRERP